MSRMLPRIVRCQRLWGRYVVYHCMDEVLFSSLIFVLISSEESHALQTDFLVLTHVVENIIVSDKIFTSS